MPNDPKPEFSGWYKFSDIIQMRVEDKSKPGIYIIAKFGESENKRQPYPVIKNIVYIGKSSYSMSSRLNYWHWAAFETKTDDDVGGGIYKHLGHTSDNGLFVAIWPIQKKLGESKIDFELRIMEIEYDLILEYIKKYGELPKCNSELRTPVYHKNKWNEKYLASIRK